MKNDNAKPLQKCERPGGNKNVVKCKDGEQGESIRIGQKSVLLFKCKGCTWYHEVKENQSREYCEYCRPIARCIHKVKVSEICNACLRIHPNGILRVMP